VLVIRPDGEIFDLAKRKVGGLQSTSDSMLHNTIAETQAIGFRDRARVIRELVVVV
jgi:molecular chaperone GrpE (heat shock protein)